jgi:hypothetical protein
MSYLLFIDSNILLDFYRFRSGDVRVTFLDHIDKNRDSIITSSQVEMEYKKNRQRVIIGTINDMKKSKPDKNVIPPIIAENTYGKTFNKKISEAIQYSQKVNDHVEKILSNPTRNDPVYKCLQRLFKSKSPYNLTRLMPVRRMIRRAAWRRFMLGYPPRKKNDTSIGDAINWEWIVTCCKESGRDAVLVTRDSDFGETFSGESMLNDWLHEEFKDRISRQRKIHLTNRLTKGFEYLKVKPKQEEINEEDSILKFLAQLENKQPHDSDENVIDWFQILSEIDK